MIRTTLNLARRPPENVRRLRLLWGGGAALLALLALVLAVVALSGWLAIRPINRQIAAVRSRIAPLQAAVLREQTPLRDPAVRASLAQAAFFNQLIDRKAVSWTLLFQRLERITPPGVALVSLRPLQRNGTDAVDIRFAANQLQPAIAFVQQLESGHGFADAHVERESEAASTPNAAAASVPARFQLEVTALYRPGVNQP